MPEGIHDCTKTPIERQVAIMEAIVSCQPTALIAQEHHCSASTVQVLRNQHRELIADKLGAIALDMSEKLASKVDAIPPANLPISLAVVIDKWLLLTGESTSRIEHVSRNDSQTITDKLLALPALDVIDVTTSRTDGTPTETQ